MEGNGRKEVYLNSDELLTAIFRYLAQKNIKVGPGVEVQWIVNPHEANPTTLTDIAA
jgi:hypothetical protein